MDKITDNFSNSPTPTAIDESNEILYFSVNQDYKYTIDNLISLNS